MHKGAYSQLPKIYAYLMQWVETNGYEPADNAREQYIDGCWNKDDESDYLTEVQMPVRKKK